MKSIPKEEGFGDVHDWLTTLRLSARSGGKWGRTCSPRRCQVVSDLNLDKTEKFYMKSPRTGTCGCAVLLIFLYGFNGFSGICKSTNMRILFFDG